MLETNKQALFFNFGEHLSYLVILRNKFRDFIKIYDDFVNDAKGIFKRLCYYFRSAGKIWWDINGFGCIQHKRKCLLCLSSMIDSQTG